MELLKRLRRFSTKPAAEKWTTIRFVLRRLFAKIPFLPVPSRLRSSHTEPLTFWWSYLLPEFHPSKRTFDYRGRDEECLLFLCRVLRSEMCFFDIGAYHGLYAIVAGKRMKPNGRITIFEPSPQARKRIGIHLRMNGLKAVVEPVALSSKSGKDKFFLVLSGFTTMSSLARPPIDAPVEEISVNTTTLDEYCRNNRIQQVDVVKVDVEGAEMELFRGAQWLLKSARPLIICEVLDWVTGSWGYPAREIIAYITRHGYEWFDFLPDGRVTPHTHQNEYPEIRNYLAVPHEKLAQIESLIMQRPASLSADQRHASP